MKKILIADDESTLRFLITETLNMLENYEIIEAIDGVDALEKYSECNPDLVILDVMMPRMTGYEVAEKLVEIENRPPIILLTAKALQKDIDKGLAIGIDHYLSKPFSPMELIELIGQILPDNG